MFRRDQRDRHGRPGSIPISARFSLLVSLVITITAAFLVSLAEPDMERPVLITGFVVGSLTTLAVAFRSVRP